MAANGADEHALGLLHFIDASPTPYHAVHEAARRLEAAGFRELSEQDAWQLEAGSRAYVIRGGSSLAAFRVGTRPAAEAGISLIGAHTDSPNLRVKPRPALQRHGYRQLGVEVYGAVLLSTWLDRDLSLAGRVVIGGAGGRPEPHLIACGRPLLRIPNLAIHLNRKVNTDGLLLNPQKHMVPVLGLGDGPELPALLTEELAKGGVSARAEDILGFDLCLHDVQPSATAGASGELIHAPRLDNLASCHAALTALVGASGDTEHTRGVVLYDHEEVGSQSAQGAQSPFLRDVLARIARSASPDDPQALERAVARSRLISADMAHAVHPNYADRHEPQHQPVLGGGPVIKSNVGQAYATDADGVALFESLCREAGVSVQHFVSRADLACGSTIGPITAGRVGLRTVDVGNPLLSMHSIREMAATADVAAMQRVLDLFFTRPSI